MNTLARATKSLVDNMLGAAYRFRQGAGSGKLKTESGKWLLYCTLSAFLFPLSSLAAGTYPELTFRHEHHLFTLDPDQFPSWRTTEEVWLFRGTEISPPQSLRVDGDRVPALPDGVTRELRSVWDIAAIAATIDVRIASAVDRHPGTVTVYREGDAIAFDGVGLPGRVVDTHRAALLTIDALRNAVSDIHLPVTVTQPSITLLDPAFQTMGITEVLAVGESNFAGSPGPRRHNIATGLHKFNGHIIPQGAVFSFNEVLGPVNQSTGYKRELVIQGDRTLPDYGGGLCQVSTTAFRGIWEYGFPIVDRRNHSFAVQYYAPQGTDATIYPPHTDMRFTNDSPGSILIQTFAEGDRAYFIYYGTRDDRSTEMVPTSGIAAAPRPTGLSTPRISRPKRRASSAKRCRACRRRGSASSPHKTVRRPSSLSTRFTRHDPISRR